MNSSRRNHRYDSPVRPGTRCGRRLICAALFLTALALQVLQTQAQIIAPSGRTIFNRNMMVRCVARLDTFKDEATDSKPNELSVPCATVWGIFPQTSLTAVVPARFRSSSGDEAQDSPARSGIGDLGIFVQYDGFFRKVVPLGFTRFAAQFGIIVPSGSADFSQDTLDYQATGVFSHIRDRHWLIGDFQYTWRTREQDGRDIGNRWGYDLSYLYRLLPTGEFRGDTMFLVFELNGRSQGQSRLGGQIVDESGGDVLYFSPGLTYLPNRRLVLEFSVPNPIWSTLSAPEPGISIVGGFRILF